jgi:transcriptional regulator with XRE-family HTH domain
MPDIETDPEAVRLGATIRALRRAHGLTIIQLARATGYSRPYLSNVECGRKTAPPGLCVKVARTLGIPLAAITVREYERIAEKA